MVPFVYRYRSYIATFVLMLVFSLALVATVIRYKIESENRQMEYLAVTKSHEIVEAIYALLYKAEALSTLVIQGNGEIKEFERIAPIIINSPVIRNILLAPAGVVSRVYPVDSNERLLGFDMLGPGAGNEEARLARDSRTLTLGGPFTPMQGGGQILVGRLPVFSGKGEQRAFWGLVSVTLSYPESLAPVRLNELESLGFACEIWRIDPDTGSKQSILRTREAPLHRPLESEFSLLNARWVISLAPLEPWYQRLSVYAMLAAAILFSALIAAIVQNCCEMRQVKASLEHMARYDALTGLPNRRAAFERLDILLGQCRASGEPFVLGYLDLNDFKDINDTFGHHVGDYVLKETARRLTVGLVEESYAGRIGGDEFLIMLRNVKGRSAQDLTGTLYEIMAKPFTPRNAEPLFVSLSVGLALYPEHGSNAEELTAHADAAMYADKKRTRSRRMRSRASNRS